MAGLKEKYFASRQHWALILGGSSGIGLAAAHKLAAEGMNIFILHRDRRQRIAELNDEFDAMRSHGVQVVHWNKDALLPETTTAAMETLGEILEQNGKVRLLLHAISKGNLKKFTDGLSTSSLMQTTNSMAFSLLPWVNAILEKGYFCTDARIIGLTSEGNKRFLPAYGAVAIAKSALETLIVNLSVELAPMGLRVNAIQAGVTATPSMLRIPDSDAVIENAKNRNPFGRITKPEDVANVVYLLCRDESAWINGAVIPVDGGEKNS